MRFWEYERFSRVLMQLNCLSVSGLRYRFDDAQLKTPEMEYEGSNVCYSSNPEAVAPL